MECGVYRYVKTERHLKSNEKLDNERSFEGAGEVIGALLLQQKKKKR